VPLKENEHVLFARAGQTAPLEVRTPTGCPACQHHGYRGRLAIMEILHIDNALDELVASGATSAQLAAHARQHGFTSLAEAALEQVANGQTSLAEISRVVDLTPWQ
jgi:general secretion pathway protein E/type IV pilus assembly protein PilB